MLVGCADVLRGERRKPLVVARLQHLKQRHSLVGSPRHVLGVGGVGKKLKIFGYRGAYAVGYLGCRFGVAVGKLHYYGGQIGLYKYAHGLANGGGERLHGEWLEETGVESLLP